MASSSVLVCAVLVLVQLVLSVGNHHAFAAKSDDGNIYMKNIETLGSLIPAADSKAIESLSGLKSGVFLISLATRGARAGCGGVKDQGRFKQRISVQLCHCTVQCLTHGSL
jgi:hypothetical protein